MKRWIALFVVGAWFWLLALVVIVGAGLASADTCAAAGPAGPGRTVADQKLTAEQMANANTIVAVVREMKLPPYAAVVALATAYQESKLRNDLRQIDHDSIGLFQQRVSIYGADTAGDPVKSTKAFLAKLIKIPNWQTRPLTDVAADVQIPREDLRDRYAQWQTMATELVNILWPGAQITSCTGDAGPAGSVGNGKLPDGFQYPTDPRQNTVVRVAVAQLGKPYVFGATGPNSWDCSSLVQAAWAAAGVGIPRVTYDQVRTGTSVPGLGAMQPGDLIFIPGSDGSAQHPGHVGMYIGRGGDGAQYLIQAPQSGDVVKVSPVSAWKSQVVSIRRPG